MKLSPININSKLQIVLPLIQVSVSATCQLVPPSTQLHNPGSSNTEPARHTDVRGLRRSFQVNVYSQGTRR